MSHQDRRRAVVVAGHTGRGDIATEHLDDEHADVRASALAALDRLGELSDSRLRRAMDDTDPIVRRRVATLAATRPAVDLSGLLDDPDDTVVEVAAWSCGEQQVIADATLERLVALTTGSGDPLVREAAAAALGAIGDERGLPAILVACSDKPQVRRRAVLALAPFEGADVEAAVERALDDRDWQVRQAAEDLRRAAGELDLR